ncbi:MAG: anaerobic ribonucleoside triphosphate reductase [bacterium]|nr:anaerobic ribonucleoside triphosphate reductase [bacterium]
MPNKNKTPTYIKKRDGRKEIFYPEKITRAVQASCISTGITDSQLAGKVTTEVLEKLAQDFSRKIPTVEQIQDLVENTLMELEQFEIAKAYILYRQERSRSRDSKSRLMQTFHGIAFDDAKDNDLKRDNANVDGDTAMGTMLKFGSESTKEFAKTCMMKPEHAQAHENGDIHIHDLDFFPMGTLTCCQIDVLDLFNRGFNTGHGYLRSPQSIGSYAALAAIILQSNQNEQHGGQGIPHFDYALAPGVKKTFAKNVAANLHKVLRYKYGQKVVPSDLKKALADWQETEKVELTYPDLNSKTSQSLLSYLKQKIKAKLETEDLKTAIAEAADDTKKETFQALEGLVHNLNTMHSRAGAQVPFTSINFGTDTSPEGRLVSEALLEATWNGLGKGETPIFPISIFKVKEGVNYNPEDPNYDLFKRSMEVSAKRLFPNFVFIDAPFNLQYYKKGDPASEAVAMGCRTRVIASVFPESDGKVTGRGNLSFTTINLVALGIKHGICDGERKEPDWDGFYAELDEKLDLVKNQLLERYEVQAEKTVKNFPFLMGQNIWQGSEKLGPNDKLRDVIKHGTLSIGFFGLAETLMAMMGKHHGESTDAQKQGLKMIKHMREFCDKMCKKYTLNFSLLATPAEGIAGRFVKLDRARFGIIPGVTDRDYYTNSFHVPVYYPISAFDKIEIEAPYHAFTNAGHITYIELDGDPLKNLDAFEAIIRKMKESGIGYGSINHPVDRDPICGYSGIIGDKCPSCGREEGSDGVGFERLRRITGYLVGTLDRWNDGKKAEEKDRVKHTVDFRQTSHRKGIK